MDERQVGVGARKRVRKSNPQQVPVHLEPSRITRLLRPYVSHLLALERLITEDVDEERRTDEATIADSPVFKYGRSLANKFGFKRYGRSLPKPNSERNSIGVSGSSNAVSRLPEFGSRGRTPACFIYRPQQQVLDNDVFDNLISSSHKQKQLEDRIKLVENSLAGILYACEPKPVDTPTNGVRTLAALCSSLVGDMMEDWVLDEAGPNGSGNAVFKEDARLLTVREICYDLVPVHHRAKVLPYHALSLAAALPDHPIKFRALHGLLTLCCKMKLSPNALHLLNELIPPPRFLHPDYIESGIAPRVGLIDGTQYHAVSSRFVYHLAGLDPRDCFSQATQSFFMFIAPEGTQRAEIMAKVIECTAQLLAHGEDEAGMWDLLDDWTIVLLSYRGRMKGGRDLIEAVLWPLIRHYLVVVKTTSERLQRILLCLTTIILSPVNVSYLSAPLTDPAYRQLLRDIPFNRMSAARLNVISAALRLVNAPHAETHVLEALLRSPELLLEGRTTVLDVRAWLRSAEERIAEAEDDNWVWDPDMDCWVRPSPVKRKVYPTLECAVISDSEEESTPSEQDVFHQEAIWRKPTTAVIRESSVDTATETDASDYENSDFDESPSRCGSANSSILLGTPELSRSPSLALSVRSTKKEGVELGNSRPTLHPNLPTKRSRATLGFLPDVPTSRLVPQQPLKRVPNSQPIGHPSMQLGRAPHSRTRKIVRARPSLPNSQVTAHVHQSALSRSTSLPSFYFTAQSRYLPFPLPASDREESPDPLDVMDEPEGPFKKSKISRRR